MTIKGIGKGEDKTVRILKLKKKGGKKEREKERERERKREREGLKMLKIAVHISNSIIQSYKARGLEMQVYTRYLISQGGIGLILDKKRVLVL